MEINREKVIKAFRDYVSHYAENDEKIKLKIEHTYHVSELCEKIARSENLSEEDVAIAWLLGMLHDIGRFEQLRRYGTFQDAESIDHAEFGADLLFRDGRIRDYITDNSQDKQLEIAVRTHSKYRLPAFLDERTMQFCNILRDADKVDILRVNIEIPLEEIYNVTTEELMMSEVTPAVMQSFSEEHATLRSIKKTPIDHLVGHISLVYELVYPYSVQVMKEQGFLEKMLAFPSQNPHTLEQFQILKEQMMSYVKRRTEE